MAQSECVVPQKADMLPERRRDAMVEVRHAHMGKPCPFGPCYADFAQSYSSVLLVVVVILSVT